MSPQSNAASILDDSVDAETAGRHDFASTGCCGLALRRTARKDGAKDRIATAC